MGMAYKSGVRKAPRKKSARAVTKVKRAKRSTLARHEEELFVRVVDIVRRRFGAGG